MLPKRPSAGLESLRSTTLVPIPQLQKPAGQSLNCFPTRWAKNEAKKKNPRPLYGHWVHNLLGHTPSAQDTGGSSNHHPLKPPTGSQITACDDTTCACPLSYTESHPSQLTAPLHLSKAKS